MNKVLLVILAFALVLLGSSVTACGKGIGINNTSIHISNPDGGGDITMQAGGKTPENFGDIPTYPGSSQISKVTGNEDMNGQPGVLDIRMYSTNDNPDKVVSFYKDKMPGNGWTEDSWYEGDINMGSYNKGETSLAVISISAGDTKGGAIISISKKYVK
jgi:hypothetical protein